MNVTDKSSLVGAGLGSEAWENLTAFGEFVNSYNVVKNHDMDQYRRVIAFASLVGDSDMPIQIRAQIEAFIMAELAWVIED